MESGLNMFRNDVVMTPLRVRQAIDSRFVKPSEDEMNVLINGTWVEFVKVDDAPEGWYDTLGFTDLKSIPGVYAVNSNTVRYTPEEMSDILPFHVKWYGTITNVDTGGPVDDEDINLLIRFDSKNINFSPEITIQSSDLPDLPEVGYYMFEFSIGLKQQASFTVLVDGYYEFRENDANGAVIGHYPIHHTWEPKCYLTSAMVGYYGKPDDGVELTAMRRLREVYAEKHAKTLKTYYADSAIIVPEIERLDMEDYYYGHIKDVVDEIVIHVENENWSVAEGLYLELYYGLKEKLR